MKLKQMERNDCFKQEDLQRPSMTPSNNLKKSLGLRPKVFDHLQVDF